MNTIHPGRRLRDAMTRGVVHAPGAFNALVARAVREAGFEAVYVSGGATANVAGFPDIGLLTMTEVCRTIREIADASDLPVIADADTGYGEVEACARTVVAYERAGAAALHVDPARGGWTGSARPGYRAGTRAFGCRAGSQRSGHLRGGSRLPVRPGSGGTA